MNDTALPRAPEARTHLRSLVAEVGEEIARAPSPALAASWARLVAELALGPEPETRVCPVCQHTGMRAATRCGHCWTSTEAA